VVVAEGQIDVKARDDGTVTLTGTVASEEQKQLVETVAANSPAVRDLRSRLVVREPGQSPPDTPREPDASEQ
jgi:osmotically-inducible protein OsmY